MRTTVRINDDLLRDLKSMAHEKKISLTKALNLTLRAGMRADRQSHRTVAPHQEQTHSMGQPRVELTHALALAATLEDGELIRKAQLRK